MKPRGEKIVDLAALYDDPLNLLKMPTSELFDLDYVEVAELQLRHFRKRFHELSGKIPRKGVQTGRLLVFDLLPDTYWSGAASGDGVTINWDGGCSCGRKGPYFHNDIGRLSDLRVDKQDNLICFGKPDAYDRLESRLANLEVSSGMAEV